MTKAAKTQTFDAVESHDLSATNAHNPCVQCGLCLHHCPTYRVSQNEAESPRGRLMLIRALAERQLACEPALAARLDSCLHCNACTAMCPAKVPYDRLIDDAKNHLRNHDGRALPPWLRALIASRIVRRFMLFALLLTPQKALDSRWARRAIGKFAPGATPDMLPRMRLKHCLPLASNWSMARRFSLFGKAQTSEADANADAANAKSVALFTGCVSQVADRETLWCGARLLEAAGYAVATPAKQTCCGALYAHSGHAAQAQELVARNRDAFKPFTHIVSCASGCSEFARARLAQSVFDFSDYLETRLAQSDDATRLQFRRLPERVIVHTPCTLRHYFDASKPITLLKRIPEIQLDILPSASRCCGAAGANMLDRSETAIKIGREVIAEIDALNENGDRRILVTSNVGCAMHLRRMLKESHPHITVMHPATLLWRQLQRDKL